MDRDDLIYMLFLSTSLGFGYFYRQIKEKQLKKWVGTSFGFFIVVAISGYHIWQCLLMFLINSSIILCFPRRLCHLVSFVFSFSYLFFIRTTVCFGVPYLTTQLNIMLMMMTLKLVGLAFDVNSAYLSKKNATQKTSEEQFEDESNDINPTFLEIFHYTFNYIMILTSPYYRYKTFRDFFDLPFSNVAPWNQETIKKLIYIPFYIVLLTLGSYIYPVSYALSEEFYNNRSWLYRFWYAWPIFFTFRMRIYGGLLLTESICTMVGLGAYPSITAPKSGLGPSKCFKEMKEIAKNSKNLVNETYNFETIHNINPYNAEFCITVRDGMKNWNMSIQYWLTANVYKRFPNKQLRTSATMLTSAFWHGNYIGYYVCIALVPFYLPIEDMYVKLFLKNNKGLSLKIWEWIIWFFKMQALSCLSMAFHLLELHEVIRYYKSTYCCGFVMAAILYLIGLAILKVKKVKVKRLKAEVCRNKENNIGNNNSK